MSKNSIQNSQIIIECIKTLDIALVKNLEKITHHDGKIYHYCRTCGYYTVHRITQINDEKSLEELK